MSVISASEAPHLQQIDLTKLSLQQLSLLKQQLDKELGVFQDSLQTLKIAQSKFQESGHCLDKVTPDAKGKICYLLFTFGLICLNCINFVGYYCVVLG